MTTVLVTGSQGYIGRHLVNHLREKQSYDVWTLDRQKPGAHGEPAHWRQHIIADLRDRIRGRTFDHVIHLAGNKDIAMGESNPVTMWINNLIATLNARSLVGKSDGRFVLASSAAVYGQQSSSQVEEDEPLDPISNYGKSKAMAEDVALSPGAPGQGVVLRLFNVHGREGDTSVHAKIAQAAAAGEVFVVNPAPPKPPDHGFMIPDDGTCVRDYVHIDRVCQAFERALTYPRPSPGMVLADALTEIPRVFNVGSGAGESVMQLVEKSDVAWTIGAEPRQGDTLYSCASTARARIWLGI